MIPHESTASRRPERCRGTRGSTAATSGRTASPIGTLIPNTHRQSPYWVNAPPSSQPVAPPPAAAAVHIPIARRRPGPASVLAVSNASAAGDSSAAAVPCAARAASSSSADPACAHSSDAPVNPTNPTANARRAPTTSATFPPTIRKPPKHNVYE